MIVCAALLEAAVPDATVWPPDIVAGQVDVLPTFIRVSIIPAVVCENAQLPECVSRLQMHFDIFATILRGGERFLHFTEPVFSS